MTKAFKKIMAGLADVERYMDGETEGFAVHIPEDVDVKSIRQSLKLSQPKFAQSFGLSVGRVRDWEQRRSPIDAPARAFFTVLRHEPDAVFRAMAKAADKPPAGPRASKATPAAAQPRKRAS